MRGWESPLSVHNFTEEKNHSSQPGIRPQIILPKSGLPKNEISLAYVRVAVNKVQDFMA
jgi:hypothetical protein